MPISHNKRFVFVCVPKTGTSSIRAALQPYLETAKIIPSTLSKGIKIKLDLHISYEEHLTLYPEARNYISFGFVRNPYFRFVSTYLYHFPKATGPEEMERFIEERTYLITPYNMFYTTQSELLKGVGIVYRYENYTDDCKLLFSRLGLDAPSLKKENETISDEDKLRFLSPSLCRIIEEMYHEDFSQFGYPQRLVS